jgi:hypothetical protein
MMLTAPMNVKVSYDYEMKGEDYSAHAGFRPRRSTSSKSILDIPLFKKAPVHSGAFFSGLT